MRATMTGALQDTLVKKRMPLTQSSEHNVEIQACSRSAEERGGVALASEYPSKPDLLADHLSR